MFVVSRVARVALAWLFVDGGLDVLRRPAGRAQLAGPTLAGIRTVIPQLPDNDVALVRANAAAQVLGGVMLVTSRRPQLAALALAGSLVPTTLAAHSYWQITDPTQRAQQRVHFQKNLAVLGGLLLAASSRRR